MSPVLSIRRARRCRKCVMLLAGLQNFRVVIMAYISELYLAWYTGHFLSGNTERKGPGYQAKLDLLLRHPSGGSYAPETYLTARIHFLDLVFSKRRQRQK